MKHPTQTPSAFQRGLDAWLRFLLRHAVGAALLCAVSVVFCLDYAARHFRMNSDTSSLIRQDAPFRRDYDALLSAFPQLDRTTVVVVSGASRQGVTDATRRLAARLRAEPGLFRSVFAPLEEDFFWDHALLYLDLDALPDALDRLFEAQPAITHLARDPSLRGAFTLVDDGLAHLDSAGRLTPELLRLVERFTRVGEAVLDGRPAVASWGDDLLAEPGESHAVLFVQGRGDFGEDLADARVVEGIRRAAADAGISAASGLRVQLTGSVPLEHEELAAARLGVQRAALVSTLLILLVLGYGVRSARMIVAAVATLLMGLAWTSAFALATVGEFNVISVTFGVLFVGLGVDIAVHYCLRLREALEHGADLEGGLRGAAAGVGGAVSLCALTSGVGFLSFAPTEYRGLAELGVIAGAGMLFALVSSFTLLPALLKLLGCRRQAPFRRRASASMATAWLSRRAGAVLAVAAVLGVGSALLAMRTEFDFSTLALKDPAPESMRALRVLQREGEATDYSLTVLADDRESARRLAARLRTLPEVARVSTPDDEVPAEQAEKLAVLSDALFVLAPLLEEKPPGAVPDGAEELAALEALRARVASLRERRVDADSRNALERMDALLLRLRDDAPARRSLESGLFEGFAAQLAWLRRALQPGAVAYDDLPASVRERLVAPDGRARVVVVPREDLRDVRRLRGFVAAVSAVAPGATGLPAIDVGVGAIVVKAFHQALALAFLAILAILLATLRSVVDTALALVPLALAALLTLATGVVLDLPLNMANVLVLPLLVGLGVDNGIHVLMRFRDEASLGSLLGSSTPRAVVLSALTTLSAFGALSLSPHRGIRSTGILLTVAVLYLLVCTLVVLPALIAWRDQRRARRSGPGVGPSHAQPLPRPL